MRVSRPSIPGCPAYVGQPPFLPNWDDTIMKIRFPATIVALTAAFVALPANAQEPAAQAQTEAGRTDTAREELAYDAVKPLGAPVPEGYKPPLTAETAIKLNAIVKRSMNALDEFDRLNDDLGKARESGDSARVAEIGKRFSELEQQAAAARTDFQAEKAALIARQEYYDKNIVVAMEYYVDQAPGEIAEALAAKGG